MAFSAQKIRTTLMGNLKAEVWSFNSAGVTTGSFSVGIGQIDHADITNEGTAGAGKIARSGQTVTITGLTSNDTGTVLVVGV